VSFWDSQGDITSAEQWLWRVVAKVISPFIILDVFHVSCCHYKSYINWFFFSTFYAINLTFSDVSRCVIFARLSETDLMYGLGFFITWQYRKRQVISSRRQTERDLQENRRLANVDRLHKFFATEYYNNWGSCWKCYYNLNLTADVWII